MVKVNRTKHKVFHWIALPCGLLAVIFGSLYEFHFASIFMLAIAVLIVIESIADKYWSHPKEVFADISDGNLVLRPFAYIGWKPIKICINDISHIIECGEPGKRKFKIQYTDCSENIDLKRMLGFSFNKSVEEDFLLFLNSEIREVEHIFNC